MSTQEDTYGQGLALGDLIAALENAPNLDAVVRWGFGEPMSYRGFYQEVAFEPAENVTIRSMLGHARSALGATFTGYKGGDYTMEGYTECWIAKYGEGSGEGIGKTLMRYWYSEAAQ